MQFNSKNEKTNNISINYNNNHITSTQSVKFFGLITDNTLSWKAHIDYLCNKLSSVCYAIRTLRTIMSTQNMRMIYFSYVHSLMSYGIIFWGNSSNSSIIFKLQKKIIRIITNLGPTDSCQDMFKELKILPLKSQYIFSLLLFVAKNKELFKTNSEIHSINTRHNSHLHPALLNLTKSQRRVHFPGTKTFNCLPQCIKDKSHDIKKFKCVLKKFLLMDSFYSLAEYISWRNTFDPGNLILIYN
jgi:hypothetical protein